MVKLSVLTHWVLSPPEPKKESLDTNRKKFFNQILEMIHDLDDQDVISKILHDGCSILNATSAALVIWEDKLGFFNSLAGFSEDMNIRGHLINTTEGLCGRIYSEQKTIWIRNYSKSIYCYKLFKKLNYKFAIGTPIIIRNELIGNVNFYYESMPETENEVLKKFVEDLSQQLSIVILNSRIYQELQEKSEKLESTVKFLNLLLDRSPNIVINLDKNGKIRYWNKTATDILGYSSHEMADCNIPLADNSNSEKFLEYFVQARKGITYEKAPLEFKKSNDEIIALNLKIIPIQRKKGVEAQSILIFATDVSKKQILEQKIKQAEQQISEHREELEKTQELLDGVRSDLADAEKLALIGRIYGNLANQINNPLMIINNWVQVLMDSFEEDTSAEGKDNYEYLMEIPSEIERIAEIVRKIRVYSEIATQKQMREVSVVNALKDAVKNIKPSIKGERIKINVISNLSKNPPMIMGRYQHLKTCFSHILENSIISLRYKDMYSKIGLVDKKGDRKIKITIEEKIINQIPYVRLEIYDSGIGIDRDEIRNVKKAFHTNWPTVDDVQDLATSLGRQIKPKHVEMLEPFCTEGFKQKLKDKNFCVGMGLTIATLIVKAHHGNIYAKSTQLKGISFIMDFRQS
ncbi:MAG: PAS domain S-box protein [Promethearchaeota archaeon]